MTQFIHLTDSNTAARIERNGIGSSSTQIEGVKGFYCTPVCRDYYRTHQWLRELKRRGMKSLHAVQFSVPSNCRVWVGRYNEDHIQVTAAEAVAIFEEHKDGLGLEVIIPAKLAPSAITRIYVPRQVTGWRFSPESKGKKPFCRCKFCNRGEINAYRVMAEKKRRGAGKAYRRA